MITIKLKQVVLTMLLISIIGLSKMNGQNSTMYFMKLVPQSNQLNPAFQNQCGLYLGMPIFSSTQFVFNVGPRISDILYRESNNDSTFTFLATKKFQNQFINSLERQKNMFAVDINLDLLSFGFRVKNLYLSFDAKLNNSLSFAFPSDFVKFMFNGNVRSDGSFINYNFGNFGIGYMTYLDYGIGASYKINDMLTVGIRPKIYSGVINISNIGREFKLESTDTSLNTNTNYTLNMSIPGVKFNFDSVGSGASPIIHEHQPFHDYPYTPANVDTILSDFMPRNRGLGIDLGAIYSLTSKLRFYASVIDLGSINWKTNVTNAEIKGSYGFKGFNATPFLSFDTTAVKSDSITKDFVDSLIKSFDIKTTNNSYRTVMPVKVYLGATYSILPWIDLGVLSRTQFYSGNVAEQFTLSANLRPIRKLSFSISYSISNFTFNNIGLGFGWKVGPFNTYFVTDKSIIFRERDKFPINYDNSKIDFSKLPYKPKAVSVPDNFSLNYRFGVNLAFGCRHTNEFRGRGKGKGEGTENEKINDKKVDRPIIE